MTRPAFLERVIAAVAPDWAARRERARLALRAYEAAQDLRPRGGSIPSAGSANAEVTAAAATIARKARDAVRNDAFARRIVDVWTANAVGAGITCAWADEAHAAAWRKWAETTMCDAEGRKTLGAIEALVVRSLVVDGEAIVRLHPVRPSPRNPVGLVLQVLDPDQLDRMKTGLHEGRAVIQGVEIGERGEAVAYWLLPRSPGDAWPLLPRVGRASSVRVPAEHVLHIFRQERPGQVRGISWLASVLPVLRDLSDYEGALLMKAKIEACLAAIVSGDDEGTLTGAGDTTQPAVTDAFGRPVETFEPGMILYRRGAGEVSVVNPSGGGSHLNFARRALERAAVGAGLTYDQVSGDLTGANYSSLRAGKIEFRALNGQVQWTILLPMLCVPIAEAFHRAGALAGLWEDVDVTPAHTPPAPEMTDPLKDTAALIAQQRAMLISPQRASALMGWQFEELVREAAAANELLDELGVVSDADPRRVAKSGVAQDAAQIAAIEIGATGPAVPRQPETAQQ